MDKRYKVISQLGNKGKEGRTFLVEDKFKCTYAGKQFRKNKSAERLMKEIELQRKSADKGISPKIVDYSIKDKYIVMEQMDCHLFELIQHFGNRLNENFQKQIIDILKKLDRHHIFQGDPNILNYMVKDDRVYIIDFGLVEDIDDKLVKKLRTSTPNMDLGLLGFVLKLRDIGCEPHCYSHLITFIPRNKQIEFGLIKNNAKKVLTGTGKGLKGLK